MNRPGREAVFPEGADPETKVVSVMTNGARAGFRSAVARLTTTTGLTLVLAGSALTGTAVAVAATAHPAVAHATKTAVVVKERTRPHFGKILVTDSGRALYYIPSNVCGPSCLSIWPRLVMPKGKTIPKGASCLGTARFGAHHRLQVTYHGKRLFTFFGDSGTSVTGNGVGGFKVAKVVRCSVPIRY